MGLFKEHPWLHTLVALNPFAILFAAYRQVIYGSEVDGGSPPGFPDWGALGLLAIGSLIFLAIAAIIFKRLEPNFAKIL